MAIYNHIGINYTFGRTADKNILAFLIQELKESKTEPSLDVGAGTLNYTLPLSQKIGRFYALEPSGVMIEQGKEKISREKAQERIQLIQGTVEELPFENETFINVTCILSLHHFSDLTRAFNEIFRVLKPCGRLTLLTNFPEEKAPLWVDDYFPNLVANAAQAYPSRESLFSVMRDQTKSKVFEHQLELQRDIQDLFFLAPWARPELYLDERIRQGISHFAKALLDDSKEKENVLDSLKKLECDLQDGSWSKKYGKAIDRMSSYDGGYRILSWEKC